MISDSELIINEDGTVFHLHLLPGEVAETIILVGDPARVELVASHFQSIELRRENREFCTITGQYCSANGRTMRVSAVSTGIGCDNIDIVVNELDALFNIDFATRTALPKELRTSLTLVRLGTSGAVQDDLRIGDYVMSEWSVGIDGLLNFYGDSPVFDREFERSFIEQTEWGVRLARPYVVANDAELIALFDGFAKRGVTISAPGFYGPQGRVLRLPLNQNDYLAKIEDFNYMGHRITNFEMEGSAIAGLSRFLGHRALTICVIIAQRVAGQSNVNYHHSIDNLIVNCLEKLTK